MRKSGKSYSKNQEQNFHNINWIIGNIFDNFEFLKMETLYYQDNLIDYLLRDSEFLKTYFDILPLQIQEEFRPNINIDLEIQNLLEFINQNMTNGNLSFMFWNNDKELDENQIQVVLENIIEAYFYNQDIDITRESLVGNGQIDFKFYKNKNEKILFEIKKASHPKLKSGFETQIVQYMKSIECKKAYYLIICFTDKDYEKVLQFIKTIKITNEYHQAITVSILDARINNKKIKLTNKILLNKKILAKIDKYFSYLKTINKCFDKESIKEYLNNIKENFHQIKNEELKQEYLKRVNEIFSQNTNIRFYQEYLSNQEKFYEIIKPKESLNNFIIHMLGNVSEENIDTVTNHANLLLDSIIPDENAELITKKQIKEIFEFIKIKTPKLYDMFKKIYIHIYLFDYKEKEFSNLYSPSLNFQDFTILFFKDPASNQIYDFFYKLGLLYCSYLTKDDYKVPKDFEQFLDKNISKYDYSKLFAISFAHYLMSNSKYQTYFPINKPLSKICENYFDNLL